MYRCVLFDMDGTLVDSYEGIYSAYRKALTQLGRAFEGEGFVRRAIGAPLPEVFENLCGLTGEETQKAVRIYREYYAKKGQKEARAYPGIRKTLLDLREAGCYLGVATLKKEEFAEKILLNLELLPLLDTVYGMDDVDSLTKKDLICRGMNQAKARPEETVLVGDSEYDAMGAAEAGVDFLAVTYGFGFSDNQGIQERFGRMRARSPMEISEILLSKKRGGIL